MFCVCLQVDWLYRDYVNAPIHVHGSWFRLYCITKNKTKQNKTTQNKKKTKNKQKKNKQKTKNKNKTKKKTTQQTKQTNKNDFKYTTSPRGCSTLYKCSLTTMAQDKQYHEKTLIRDRCNHKGSCTLFKTILTIAAGMIQYLRDNWQWVSCPKEFKHTQFSREQWYWLELATSRTSRKRRFIHQTTSLHLRWVGIVNL